jgi:hypothetical protein
VDDALRSRAIPDTARKTLAEFEGIAAGPLSA